MLIVEIVLGVMAWRRGWKGQALLPFALILPFLVIGGLLAGPEGAHSGAFAFLSLTGDVAIIGSLVYMVRRPRSVSRGVHAAAPSRASQTGDRVNPRAA